MDTSTEDLDRPSANDVADAIEGFLKWLSIAYGLGFITVMVHTAPYGIPILELAEPVQIWVGLPLAAIFWLVLQAYKYSLRQKMAMQDNITRVKSNYDRFESLVETQQLVAAFDILVAPYTEAFIAALPLFGGRSIMMLASRFINGLAAERLAKTYGSLPTEELLAEFGRYRGAFIRTTSVFHFMGFVNKLVGVFLPLGFLAFLYILVFYPRIPQSWGGGKPMTVTLIVSEEKLPLDDSLLRFLFKNENAAGSSSSKIRISSPVQILYSTDHAYYVSLGAKTFRISSDAVGGVFYSPP